MRHKSIILCVVLALFCFGVSAQNELVATMEVLQAGVSVQRAGTASFITVNEEAIVGVGDIIETNETGRARITFFADGTETELLPNTQYTIVEFTGDDTTFNLTVEILVGQTTQRLGRILDANSSYDVRTSGMTLAARGTVFDIRVLDNGQSGMIVTEGIVNSSKEGQEADVPNGFGVRAESEGALSDVVAATNFAELDSALDGCTTNIRTTDDVSLNVRLAPSTEAPRVGTIAASDVTILLGTIDGTTRWYRIAFRGGFGWILSSTAAVGDACSGLRVFPSDVVEDASLYESLGDSIEIDALTTPQPEVTPEATPGS
jgi:hypothetical protein